MFKTPAATRLSYSSWLPTADQFSPAYDYFDFANTANSFIDGFDHYETSGYFAAAGEIGVTAVVAMPTAARSTALLTMFQFSTPLDYVDRMSTAVPQALC